MPDNSRRSTLQIKFSFGATLLASLAILIIVIFIAEYNFAARSDLPPDALSASFGIINEVLDVKLIELRRNVAQRGGVDVIFLGSSQTNNAIDTARFEQEFRQNTGLPIRAYNLGSQALGIADARWLLDYLHRQYQPKLIVYGTTFRDFSGEREIRFFSDNSWIHYQQGYASLDGWLRENLLTYQSLLVFRNWMKPDYREQMITRESIHRRLQPLGYMPNRDSNPQLVGRPPSLDDPEDQLIFDEYADSYLADSRIQILRDFLAYQSHRLGVVILEIPVHPSFVDYFPNGWEDQAEFVDEIGAVVSDSGSIFLPTTGMIDIPENGWFDRNHLSMRGADYFTSWLVAELANSPYVTGRLSCGESCPPPEPSSFRPFSQGLPFRSNPLLGRVDMNESLFRFAFFCLLVLALYYYLPHNTQNLWLLFASYVFYTTWSWKFTITLISVTLVNYLIARKLPVLRKGPNWLLRFGIIVNLVILVFFKYNGFFVNQFFSLLGVDVPMPFSTLRILLPVGLSYLTLNSISYLLDVSRGVMTAAHNFVDFALYTAYFPKLLSGPIERARRFLPILAEKRVVDNQVVIRSVTLILIGLTRKFIIADTLLAMMPADVFEKPFNFTSPELFAWLLGYGFYIYNDFAGYTNIVRGVSGLFGIELSYNFRQPVFALNFADFWNRWHRSLSNWLRDYIFLPLNRSLLRRYKDPKHWSVVWIPPLATMLASGLWHGATLNLILWGFTNGLLQAFERFRQIGRTAPLSTKTSSPWQRITSSIKVAGLSFLTAVPFILPVWPAYSYYRAMSSWRGWELPAAGLGFLLVVSLIIDWIQVRSSDEVIFARLPLPVRSLLLAAVVLAFFFVTRADVGAPFIYQGF